jgi:hypothetical protein
VSPDVVMVYGFWGQNIGNAFFNVGGEWILQQVFGPERVGKIQDQPGYRTFHDQSKGNPGHALDLLGAVQAEVLVLQGPMLTETFRALWQGTFRTLAERGTKIVLLGAALFRFTPAEIEAARQFVRDSKIAAIVTRDSDTYHALKDDVPFAHDGVDSAFFVPDAVSPVALDLGPYYCFTFDRFPEPSISLDGPSGAADQEFTWDGYTWGLKAPRTVARLAGRGKAQAYVGHLVDRRKLPLALNGRRIVRPEHRTNPHITWKVYQRSAAVASDEPFTYFALYSQADLTLSDRVHACVATLAYGKPAMLFTPSPRARLFDRVRASDIRSRPVSVDPAWLAGEKAAELEFLHGVRGELGL